MLFFIRVSEAGEIKRSDLKDIIIRLIQKGDTVDIYDTATATHYKVEAKGILKTQASGRIIKKSKPALFISRVSALYWFSKRNRKKYDVAHFCYIREEFLILSGSVLKVAGMNIATVFGADVGQRNLVKKCFKQFIYDVDIVTITGTNGRDLLKKYFRYKELVDHIVQLPLPSVIMKAISVSGLNKGRAKQKLGFREDDCVVVCGSVLSANEQYEHWIPVLKNCLGEKEGLVFVFPFSYGDKNLLAGYSKLIEENIPSGNFKILSGWMTVEDTAVLRMATDILISLRKNDQFAGIIIESLFTNAAVITGEWLGYQYLEENNVWHYRTGDFASLEKVFNCAYSDISNPDSIKRLKSNSDKLSKDLSYESSISGWDEFYEKVRRIVEDEKIK